MGECKHGTWRTFCPDCDLEQVEGSLQLHGGGESRSALPPIAQPDAAELLATVKDFLRLATMGFEASLREPEEDGNYAVFSRAKRLVDRLDAGTTPQQASMDGSELKPEAHPILQGPTREEVARIIEEEWSGLSPKRSHQIAARILALLNPTSPWRDMADAPKDGTEVDLAVEWSAHLGIFGMSPSRRTRWPAAKWIGGDWSDGTFSLGQYEAKPQAVGWMPLPALPGGESGT